MVSDNIKKLRNALHMTQEEFGDKIGESRNVIANIENNRWSDANKRDFVYSKICKRFGIPLDWILADNPGDVPLPEMTEADEFAKKTGEMVSGDPVVKSFLEFWSQRTDKEREQLTQAIEEFYAILQKNKEE